MYELRDRSGKEVSLSEHERKLEPGPELEP